MRGKRRDAYIDTEELRLTHYVSLTLCVLGFTLDQIGDLLRLYGLEVEVRRHTEVKVLAAMLRSKKAISDREEEFDHLIFPF